jgi:hypothetical protein
MPWSSGRSACAGALLDAPWSAAHVIRLSGLQAICSAILILAISLLWKARARNAGGDELGSLSLDPRDQEA